MMKRAPDPRCLYKWKDERVAYAPDFKQLGVIDEDGVWEATGMGYYELVQDRRSRNWPL